MLKRCSLFAAVALLTCSVSYGDIYTGSLSTTNGGLVGLGNWANPSTPTTFSWTIDTGYAPGIVRYSYTMIATAIQGAGISHLNLETSDGFGSGDITTSNGIESIGTIPNNAGSPHMPSSIYGIKFDGSGNSALTIVFDSPRMPVWGDFYAKGGSSNEIWNSGFGTPDPLDLPSTLVAGHILRPDSINIDTDPEYGTLVIHKFRDDNSNGVWDQNESLLMDGFEIDATGEQTFQVQTANGTIIYDVPVGFYSLLEVLYPRWTFTGAYWTGPNSTGATGGNPLTNVQVFADATTNVYFGNVYVPEPVTLTLLAVGSAGLLSRRGMRRER